MANMFQITKFAMVLRNKLAMVDGKKCHVIWQIYSILLNLPYFMKYNCHGQRDFFAMYYGKIYFSYLSFSMVRKINLRRWRGGGLACGTANQLHVL